MGKLSFSALGLLSAIAVTALPSGMMLAAPAPAAPARPAAAPAVTVPPAVAARPQGYADLAARLLPMVVNI